MDSLNRFLVKIINTKTRVRYIGIVLLALIPIGIVLAWGNPLNLLRTLVREFLERPFLPALSLMYFLVWLVAMTLHRISLVFEKENQHIGQVSFFMIFLALLLSLTSGHVFGGTVIYVTGGNDIQDLIWKAFIAFQATADLIFFLNSSIILKATINRRY